MSSQEGLDPGVIAYEGIFSDIPTMHGLFCDVFGQDAFSLDVGDDEIAVRWFRLASAPNSYQFIPTDQSVSSGGPYEVYDLTIDDGKGVARLNVLRQLGRKIVGDNDEIESEWHKFQIDAGMTVPNAREIEMFKKIFIGFCLDNQ